MKGRILVKISVSTPLPSPGDLAEREELCERLSTIGVIDGKGSGGFAMDVYLEVDDLAIAVPAVERVLEELDLAKYARLLTATPCLFIVVPCDAVDSDCEDLIAALTDAGIDKVEWYGWTIGADGPRGHAQLTVETDDLVATRRRVEQVIAGYGLDAPPTYRTDFSRFS